MRCINTILISHVSSNNLYGDFVQINAVQAYEGDVTINLQGGSDTIPATPKASAPWWLALRVHGIDHHARRGVDV